MIGGGIVGCATAYNLAKRGVSVVLLEKGDVAGEQSSRNWGWVSQLRNPVEAPLQMLSQSIWTSLEDELSADLEWYQGGGMYLAADEAEFATLSRQAGVMAGLGQDVSVLTKAQVQELIPVIAGDWYGAYYNRTNGQADPVKTTTAFANAAREQGVQIFTHCAVEDIVASGGEVGSLQTECGEIAAPTVVCAAGAWSGRLGRMAGLELPQRKVRATVARTNTVPIFNRINVWGGGVAARQRNDGSLIIAGDGTADYDVTLDSFRHFRMFMRRYREDWRSIRPRVGGEFVRDLGRRMPWSDARKHPFAHTVGVEPEPNWRKVRDGLSSLIGLYPHLEGSVHVEQAWAGYIDGTPDRVPVIGGSPELKGFLFATGFSGHGFQMGPGAGQVVAELILDGKPSVDISGLRYTRFAEGALNPEP